MTPEQRQVQHEDRKEGERDRSARIFPFAGDGKWYWKDADCDEPMGPFDSYREAARDYNDVRHPSSAGTGRTP